MTVSGDQQLLAVGKANGEVEIVNIKTGAKSLDFTAFPAAVEKLGFSDNSDRLFVIGADDSVAVFDAANG